MPDLTVWIPTYNRSGFLRECLTALLEQGLARDDWQVVVSDNASTDDTPAVCAAFADRLPIVHRRRERNVPAIDNIDAAGDEAGTRYVAFVCDDDLVPPGQLGRGLRVLRARDDGVLYGALGLGLGRFGDPAAWPLGMLLDCRPVDGDPFLLRWETAPWLANCSLHTPLTIIGSIFRLDRIPSRPLFPREFPQEADRHLFIRLAGHGTIYSAPWIGGYLRYHGAQQTHDNEHGEQRDLVTRLALDTAKSMNVDLAAWWVERLKTASEGELEFIGPRLLRRWPEGMGDDILRRAGADARLAQLRAARKGRRRKGGLIGRLRSLLGG
jgi:glycosyltransferase involved in cell wall biosynthesis